MRLILASASPRRAELLRAAGIPFTVRVADIDETPLPHEDPAAYVVRLAREKARAVPRAADEAVLAADTTVVVAGEIFGKPTGPEDAARMLRTLSGRAHEVLTGVCLLRGESEAADLARTAVWCAPLTESEIADYVASGEPMDKAGGYAIQGLASKFILRIEGSYANVMGLPVDLVYRLLSESSRQR